MAELTSSGNFYPGGINVKPCRCRILYEIKFYDVTSVPQSRNLNNLCVSWNNIRNCDMIVSKQSIGSDLIRLCTRIVIASIIRFDFGSSCGDLYPGLVNQLPDVWRRRTILFGLFLGTLFTAIVGWLGLRLVVHLAQSGQVSAVMEAPMWLIYLCLPLGSFLMCFRFLEVAWIFHHTGVLPRHDPGAIAGLPSDGGANPNGSRT